MADIDTKCINAIRVLAADAIQKAKSGHPGLPLGSAPMAYELWANHMNHNPKDSKWANRDRFILSAGHGSTMLYALLHLYGYGLTIDDMKEFRQLDSKTPGHPEYGWTAGVEATTGPLGAGMGMAVGMAMAEAHLASVFNKPGYPIVDHYTFALGGDGCMMEGISSEAFSLAGTLGLSKLIVLYDSNNISIEGSTDLAFTENVQKRMEAFGFQLISVEDLSEKFFDNPSSRWISHRISSFRVNPQRQSSCTALVIATGYCASTLKGRRKIIHSINNVYLIGEVLKLIKRIRHLLPSFPNLLRNNESNRLSNLQKVPRQG